MPSQQPIGHPLLSNSTTQLNTASIAKDSLNIQDIDTLFNSLGLNKYTNLFKHQEVSTMDDYYAIYNLCNMNLIIVFFSPD